MPIYIVRTTNIVRQFNIHCAAVCRHQGVRPQSTFPKHPKLDIAAFLEEPSWSVRDNLFTKEPSEDTTPINRDKLHHLLRLSALPLPKSPTEETKMIEDLRAHLKFVQAIQRVDTEGVKPLEAIRDESKGAKSSNTYTTDSLSKELEKEEFVGRRRRLRKKSTVEAQNEVGSKNWNPLNHAGDTQGTYFVVDIAKD